MWLSECTDLMLLIANQAFSKSAPTNRYFADTFGSLLAMVEHSLISIDSRYEKLLLTSPQVQDILSLIYIEIKRNQLFLT